MVFYRSREEKRRLCDWGSTQMGGCDLLGRVFEERFLYLYLAKGPLAEEPLTFLLLSFVSFASMSSDPQIIDTDGPTSHRHVIA
jgi:hypothetical protein